MAQATSGEKEITIEGQKYRLRTQVVYQNGLGVTGTLSTTAPIRYVVQYKPLPSPLNPVPDWSNLGERDTNNTNNWIFTPIAGGGFKKALSAKGSNSLTTSLDDATSNALSKSAKVTKQQANLILQVAPNVAPTVPAPQPTPTPASGTTPASTPEPKEINDPGLKSKNSRDYDDYFYPETLRINTNKQDVIKFTAYSYGGRPLTLGGASSSKFGTPGLGDRILKSIKGSVTLPIQPSITDTNGVTWGNEELNPLQAFGAAVSYAAGENVAKAGQEAMSNVEKLFKESGGDVEKAVRIFLAGKAVGVNGLLSRIGGAILNPNLELIFQGPQLRPFNFTFRLSPRNKTEAEQVKNIIRFFKQNMSIKNNNTNLFLQTPNVFKIRYLLQGEKDHPSINRIKICALQSCSVDYTPDGSYITFSDPSATMTSYGLTLQFMELEPITENDYVDDKPNLYKPVSLNEIGY